MRDLGKETQLALHLTADFPGKTPEDIQQFIRSLMPLAARLQHLEVKRCNTPLSPIDERNEANAERLLRMLCKEFGVEVSTDGDPRGYVVKLLLPSRRANNLGEGWGV